MRHFCMYTHPYSATRSTRAREAGGQVSDIGTLLFRDAN